MKTMIALIALLAFFASTSEACFGCGTAATCKSPCYTCGWCAYKCCQNLFREGSTDRFIIPCLSGREDEQEDVEEDGKS